ncbi:MAG: hypothetical protein AABZ06_02065 [Bdellovibrionota bacterium]
MKKMFLTIAVIYTSTTSVYAQSYICEGVDRASNDEKATFTINKVSHKSIEFVDTEENDLNLSRNLRDNEGTYKFAVYADYEYDDYGGFIKISIPQSVATSSQDLMSSFVAYYQWTTYSEAGKVGEIDIKAVCKPNNR